jgi:hypothetical protein
MSEETTQPEAVAAPEFVTTLTPEQIAAAQKELRSRPFSERNPLLGKMIKCQVCGHRHREAERKCEQVFTFVTKGKDGLKYSRYVDEEKDGEVSITPLYRTAVPQNGKPTLRQLIGAAAFAKKRYHPHFSKTKLQFIQRVRVIFQGWEDKFNQNLEREPDETLVEKLKTAWKEGAQKTLHRARTAATRQMQKERGWDDFELRRRLNGGKS